MVFARKKLVTYNGRQISTPQGKLAIDVNDNDVSDDRLPFDDEQEALRWLYHKTLSIARAEHWPLDEMFHDGFGYIKERGYSHNHPIGGHDHHFHIGWYRLKW